MDDKTSVLSVEKGREFCLIQKGVGEFIFYEGGCSFNSNVSSFTFPYDNLAKNITVSSKLLSKLKEDIPEMHRLYEEDRSSSEGEIFERRIIRNERKLALIAQEQGLDLTNYFKHYNGFTINW